ncbi:MAG TPA: response regulator [Tepidisphaeraceae bacterium]|jgi:DNA-binding response OmpR family regulator
MPDTDNGKPRRVLVVEDDPSSRKALMLLLKRQGHEVDGADCARQALDKLVNKPEIVVLDLMLPDGLGIAVLRQIRMQGLPAQVAILTGVHEPQSISEITEYEPDAIFTKPLNLESLIEWMRTGVVPWETRPL